MYHRELNWEKYLDRNGYREDSNLGLVRTGMPPAAPNPCTRLIVTPGEMPELLERLFGAPIPPSELRTVTPESLRSTFDWALGSLLWKLELTRTAFIELSGSLRAGLPLVASEALNRGEHAYLSGRYTEALSGFQTLASFGGSQDFSVYMTLGHIYLYHQRPVDPEKARAAYLRAAGNAASRAPLYSARASLWAAFAAYLLKEDQDAYELAEGSLTLSDQWSESYFSQARYAALLGEPDIALRALEAAIRADKNFALRAAILPDFAPIEARLTELLERLRAEAHEQADSQGRALQVETTASPIPTQEQPIAQRQQAEIAERWRQDTYFGYVDAAAKMMRFKLYLAGLHLPARDRVANEARRSLADFRAQVEAGNPAPALLARLDPFIKAAEDILALSPTRPEAQKALDQVRQAVKLWDLATGHTILDRHLGEIRALSFSPNSAYLASSSASEHVIRLWDTLTGDLHAQFNGHNDEVTCLAFSPNSQWLASGCSAFKGGDFTVRLWNPLTGALHATLDWHTNMVTGLAFSPSETLLASSSGDASVRLWALPGGEKLDILDGHQAAVTCLAFTPDGSLLLSGSEDQTIRTWDMKTNQPGGLLLGHSAPIQNLLITPDGQLLISRADDLTLRLWKVKECQLVKIIEVADRISALALSPDGSRLAWAAGTEGQLAVWQLGSDEPPAVLRGSPARVTALAFSPDNQMLCSASENGVLRLWDMANDYANGQANGQAKGIRVGHHGRVTTLVYSPDGVLLASGGADHTIHLWGASLTSADTQAIAEEETERTRQAEQQRKQRAAEVERQRQAWRAEGCCEVCGTRLGMVERLAGYTRCKEHR
jgi:WD domain, G-beta repeat